ncbi:MAG TPA: SpoVR family protein, partial [Pirellulales bacterium]
APVQSHFAAADEDEDLPRPGRFRSKGYMEQYINPPAALAAETAQRREQQKVEEKFPKEPVRDVMLFVLEHAPLKPWQLDVLSIVRDEAYYFAPQGQTKIMNEGWASYWHSTIMTRQGLLPSDVVNYCDHHSGTMATSAGRLNPYKLGLELLRDIEDRWNKGRFGKEYDECDDLAAKRDWNTAAGLGRAKIFEVRKIHNDLTFIDTFLTLEFCREHKLFSFGYNEDTNYYEIESREFPKIKQRLLFSLTHRGQPFITVRDGNYKNRGELYLEHEFNGVELQMAYARDTLVNLQRLWGRPVHIESVLEGEKTILSYDGSEHSAE